MDKIKKILSMFSLCGLLFAASTDLSAETIGMKQAKAMAQNFFNESRHYVTGPVSYVYNGKDLTGQRLFTPFYVFNSPAGGFVVISAENKAFPVLAYSLKQNFDKSKMTSMVKSILTDFSRDIEMIRYDSRIPSDAIEQWITYPNVVFDIFGNPDNDDFYPASFDDKDEVWMVRRYATEFDFETAEPVEYAFAPLAVDEIQIPESPVVTSNGAGHFSLSLPVEIDRVIIYNVAGSMAFQKKFRNTNVAHIDLAGEPNGFYIALLIDKDGIRHATKLYR
ncbi:MAG: Spi family protease inhibitor [Muribaculum sp.]|nr:Spi family protease inhibitor [Muribaculum sp.]